MASGEPSDAIRAVNAVLTNLDAIRNNPNVMILTTSNLTNALDGAFMDRADIQVRRFSPRVITHLIPRDTPPPRFLPIAMRSLQ